MWGFLDFNIQPSEGTYRLMTGAPLSAAKEDALQLSTVVHKTLDDYNYKLREAERLGQESLDDQGGEDEDDEDKDDSAGDTNPTGEVYAQPEGDEDRVLKNTRPARDSDGLLSLDEMKSVYEKHRNNMWSLYGHYCGTIKGEAGNWFGERDGPKEEVVDDNTREERINQGYYEPAWTNGMCSPAKKSSDYSVADTVSFTTVTPLWRCTLDYIFYIPPPADGKSDMTVKRLLRTHRLADLEPGLPRMNKEPSDHVALMAEIEI
jgi:RNA exonuclease NGL2